MRFITALLLNFLFFSTTFGQMHNGKFGNEWIQHNQSYFKLKISKDAVHRIDRQVLSRDIPNFQQIPADQFQLFCMGESIPLYVHAPNGIVEYIEFYGERNKGTLDVHLYRSAHHHFNPDYSLFSDVGVYFLTWAPNNNQQYQDHNSNFNNLSIKEPYFIYEAKVNQHNQWNKGKAYSFGPTKLAKGIYEYGEGYGSSFSKNHSIEVLTPYVVHNANIPAKLNVRGTASSGFSYHKLAVGMGSKLETFQQFNADSVYQLSLDVLLSSLGNQKSYVTINGTAGSNDLHSISTVSISYPRSFNFGNQSSFQFEISASNSSKYLEIENFDGGASSNQNVFLYDLTNRLRISSYWDGSKVRVVLPPSTKDRQLVLINNQKTESIINLEHTHFENYTIPRGNYIVVSHPSLFSDSDGNNPVLDYGTYRQSTGNIPSIHNIKELTDQFAYGVEGHPLAIKNFAAYIDQHWSSNPPEYLFLIGKGLNYTTVRNQINSKHLIPSFGHPASDNLLSAKTGSDVPRIAIGRLAATTGDEVRTYLNKIKAIELEASRSTDFDNQQWRNQIVHLGGGANSNEQQLFKYYLNEIKKNVPRGNSNAKVHSFFKNNDDHVRVPNSVMIDSLINHGVSMVTFYGHGSVTSFDYYLNRPDYYNNKDRYPFVFAMGCYNGTLYESEQYMSEKFVFQEDAGASAYLSFVNVIMAHSAFDLGNEFYELGFGKLYGEGIGKIIQTTLDSLSQQGNGYTLSHQIASNYLVFHGDPALKLHHKKSPDYYIDAKHISSSPQQIKNDARNFNINLDLYNWGTYKDTTLLLKVIRHRPFGAVDTMNILVDAPRNKTNVAIRVPVNGYEDLGINRFSFFIDADQRVQELPHHSGEANNSVLDFEIQVGNAVATPIYPSNYAIVNTATVTLSAQTSNAFDVNQTWSIEMDTTTAFDSPILVTTTVASASNRVDWTANMTLKDQQVYYWRIRASSSQLANDWQMRSFIYMPTSPTSGWNQSHVYQYQENDFDQLSANNDATNPLIFSPSLYEVGVKTGFVPDALNGSDLALYQNGSVVDKCRCSGKSGVYVAVFDPNSLSFWTMPGGSNLYGAVNCDPAGRTAYSFLFETNSLVGQQNFSNFVLNTIPDGHLVLIYTLNNAFGAAWDSNLVTYLKTEGATAIDDFAANQAGDRPYTFAFQKGNGTHFREALGDDKTSVVHASTVTTIPWHKGKMTSPLVGPVKNWNVVEWKSRSLDSIAYDQISVDLWGINEAGGKTLLHQKIDSSFDISHIDAAQFPYLQLVMNQSDPFFKTAAQLDYWRVLGNMHSDVVLGVNQDYSITYDSIQQGDQIHLDLSISNASGHDVASNELDIIILGQDTFSFVVPALSQGGQTNIQVSIPSGELEGQQVLIARLKPIVAETNLNNNWGWFDFYINSEDKDVAVIDIASQEQGITNLKNYPNPFVDYTQIEFEAESDFASEAQIDIYDTRGVLVSSHSQFLENLNTWTWEASQMPAGTYFCVVKIEGMQNQTLKLIKS